MSGKPGAYGARAGDTDFRKKWDKEEYAEKARQRDQDEKERMQENEERLKQGAPHPQLPSAPLRAHSAAPPQARNHARRAKMTCRSRRSS